MAALRPPAWQVRRRYCSPTISGSRVPGVVVATRIRIRRIS
jgi:hypothetical protein